MIDTQRVKQGIDCRDLIERDLGRPKVRGGDYATFKCPLHHEVKGFSLVVYADHWRCLGKCGRGGDAIDWLRAYHGLSFRAACERLASGDVPRVEVVRRPEGLPPPSEPPDSAWQRAARQVVQQAADTLWSRAGERARRYLEGERGLSAATIAGAGLGYIPGDYRAWRTVAGLRVPCGITIPWLADGALWAVKVRRSAGEPRYQQVSGGNVSGCLYLADGIVPGLPLLLTEGEFDALTAQQAGVGLISAAATGSAANRRISARWFGRLMAVPSILVCMDDDEAGRAAAEQMAGLTRAARCVRVAADKDVNAFYQRAGHEAVRGWLAAVSAV